MLLLLHLTTLNVSTARNCPLWLVVFSSHPNVTRETTQVMDAAQHGAPECSQMRCSKNGSVGSCNTNEEHGKRNQYTMHTALRMVFRASHKYRRMSSPSYPSLYSTTCWLPHVSRIDLLRRKHLAHTIHRSTRLTQEQASPPYAHSLRSYIWWFQPQNWISASELAFHARHRIRLIWSVPTGRGLDESLRMSLCTLQGFDYCVRGGVFTSAREGSYFTGQKITISR